jgi:hypothetical protein
MTSAIRLILFERNRTQFERGFEDRLLFLTGRETRSTTGLKTVATGWPNVVRSQYHYELSRVAIKPHSVCRRLESIAVEIDSERIRPYVC